MLFLMYAFLLGTSFFALALTLPGFDVGTLPSSFAQKAPVRFSGGFLIFNTFAIAFMWLSVVVPPLLDGSIYPVEVQHYTTLIVQVMDLGLLLPLSFVSGILLLKRRSMGFLLGPVYLAFLSLLMTALLAKIIAMGTVGASIIPAVFIIPVICLVTIASAFRMVRAVEKT